jgi:phosphoribosylglycinamide formyltransferase-1
MPAEFVSEPITPLEASFDAAGMARGEPGLPQQFRWRKKVYLVVQVLEQGKEHGNCRHGSGERYVRRHTYRVRTADGTLFQLYFQRSFGRGRLQARRRWWVRSVETADEARENGQSLAGRAKLSP